MHQLAAAQRRYDRQVPMESAPQVARLLQAVEPDPFAAMRKDIAADCRAAQDISTAWYDGLFDEDDNNMMVSRLFAGDDSGALAVARRALCIVAEARAASTGD